MKTGLKEIFDPAKKFYEMKNKSEKKMYVVMPIVIGAMWFGGSLLLHGNASTCLLDIMNDIINQFITITALFISFTMAYLTILITSSSKNVEDLKREDSDLKDAKGKFYSIYQEVTTEITYTVIVEIIFLIFCVFEKFVINYVCNEIMKIFCAMDIAIFIHILLLMLIIVKDIYYTFWRSR